MFGTYCKSYKLSCQGGDRKLYHDDLEEAFLVRYMRPNKTVVLSGGRKLDNRGEADDFGMSDVEAGGYEEDVAVLVEDAFQADVRYHLLFSNNVASFN